MNLKKRAMAFAYAANGIFLLFKTETHAKFHAIAAITVIILGFYFNVSPVEWCILLLCISLVISLEAINSAIESLTDLATKEIHPLAKKTKDLAAGGVLISSILAAIIGAIIFIPKLL